MGVYIFFYGYLVFVVLIDNREMIGMLGKFFSVGVYLLEILLLIWYVLRLGKIWYMIIW